MNPSSKPIRQAEKRVHGQPANDGMQRTALRAASDAERLARLITVTKRKTQLLRPGGKQCSWAAGCWVLLVAVACTAPNVPQTAETLIAQFVRAYNAQDSLALTACCMWPASRERRISQLIAFRRQHGPLVGLGPIVPREAKTPDELIGPTNHDMEVALASGCGKFLFNIEELPDTGHLRISNVRLHWVGYQPDGGRCLDRAD